jgi:hypothetical protein
MSDWAQTTQTLNFQLHRIGAELETIGTNFGKDVLPAVTEGVKLFTDFLTVIGKNKALLIGLGSVITAILVPAIGLYLKGALLSSSGAIMGVLRAYQRLIFGQSEEQVALARMDGSLSVNDAALRANAGALTSDDAAAMRTGGLAGAGGGLGGKFLGAAGLAGAGLLASSLIPGRYTLNSKASATSQTESILKSTLAGAGIGAGIGSFFGPEGTLIGGGIGGASGAIYSERSQIASVGRGAWDDLFGGGSPAPPPRSRLNVHAHLYVDGKQMTTTVKQNVKKAAARR